MFFISDLLLESEVMSASKLGKVADITSAFLDTQINLITATSDGKEFMFKHNGNSYKIKLGDDSEISLMSEKNAKNEYVIDNQIGGFKYVFKTMNAEKAVKDKIAEIKSGLSVWKK